MFGLANEIPVDTGAFLHTQITSTWHALVHEHNAANSIQMEQDERFSLGGWLHQLPGLL